MAWRKVPATLSQLASPLQIHDPHSHYIGDPEQIARSLQQWLWAEDVPKVSLTLLARPKAQLRGLDHHTSITNDEFSKAISLLLKKLSRPFLTIRAVERGKRLHHAFVSESGSLKGRLHYHGWIERPLSAEPADFCALIEETWKSLSFGDEADVKAQCDQGWVRYMLKPKRTGEAVSHIDLRNVSLL